MEVKINREIRNYTESMFFGLSMRQCVFTVLAASVAILLYFVLKPYVGTETVSWMCILGAAPFAAMGFVTYHGMTAELQGTSQSAGCHPYQAHLAGRYFSGGQQVH